MFVPSFSPSLSRKVPSCMNCQRQINPLPTLSLLLPLISPPWLFCSCYCPLSSACFAVTTAHSLQLVFVSNYHPLLQLCFASTTDHSSGRTMRLSTFLVLSETALQVLVPFQTLLSWRRRHS